MAESDVVPLGGEPIVAPLESSSSSSSTPPPPPPTPMVGRGLLRFSRGRLPAVRVTSEYDSDRSNFFHKVSCKLLDGLAKLKLTFQNDSTGAVSGAQLSFLTNNLSFLYDLDSNNALVTGSFRPGNHLHFRASREIKGEQGEVAMVASLLDPSYKLEVSSPLPILGLPRAAVQFPIGEVVLEKRDIEATNAFSVNAMLRTPAMNGILTAFSGSDEMRLRFSYKDEELTFIPSISLPANVSFAFKRTFSPLDKLSYWYHFSNNDWSAVYKRTVGKDLKFKAGYDSNVRIAWASLWVGDENGKITMAPMKTKMQFMLQVPQDDIANSVFLFRVKKRWEF